MFRFILIFPYIVADFSLLREKLSAKSYLSDKIELISGKGAFAKMELKRNQNLEKIQLRLFFNSMKADIKSNEALVRIHHDDLITLETAYMVKPYKNH